MKNNNQICPKCGTNLIIEFDYQDEPMLEICGNRPKCDYFNRLTVIQECAEEDFQAMNKARIKQSLSESYFKDLLVKIKDRKGII